MIVHSRVVGLDLSLKGPGVCAASGDARAKVGEGLEIEVAKFRAGEDVRGPQRLATVSRAIESWLASRGLLTPGRLFAQEGYSFASQQAHSLGEIGGCVRMILWEYGCNLIVVPPSTLKKYLTGKGVGDKNIVMKHVFKRWAFDSDDDDECDAFGCSVLGLVAVSDDAGWTNAEREILTKKVERYAGQGQEGWLGGAAPGKVAGRAGRRASRRARGRSAVLGEDLPRT